MDLLCEEEVNVSVPPPGKKHQSFLGKLKSTLIEWNSKKPAVFLLVSSGVLLCIIVIAVVLPVCLLHGCGAGNGKQDMPNEEQQPLRLIVHFDNIQSTVKSKVPPSLRDLFDEVVLTAIRINIANFKSYEALNMVQQYLQSLPDVLIIVRDREQGRLPPQLTPPTYAALRRQIQEGANNASQGDAMTFQQWALDKTSVRGAWNKSQGGGVIVAVVDSGCDAEHPDLKDNLWINPGEIPNDGLDNDMNNRTDDMTGYDFAGPCSLISTPPECGPRPNVSDIDGHGTQCSGIIGAVRNNGVGIIGVAPQVKIMCLKVVPNDRVFYLAHILSAINYAITQGAHIISCSFGPKIAFVSEQVKNETELYKLALQKIKDKNMLLVAAAGNEDTNLDNVLYYNPCTLVRDFPDNVLCVMATDEQNSRLIMGIGIPSSASNYGRQTVSVAAPGRDILSTSVPKTWVNSSGTSMAAPMTAGVAALIMSVLAFEDGSYFKGVEARSILVGTGSAIDGLDKRLVNASRAMDAALSQVNGVTLLNEELAMDSQKWLMVEGFNLTYYSNRSFDTSNIIDEGTQVIVNSARIEGYKHSNATLEVIAYMKFPQPGLYAFRINTTGNYSRIAVTIGGREIRNLTQTQSLQSAGGWHVFRLTYENPVAPINILMSRPGEANTLQFASGVFYIATDQPARNFSYAPDIALSSAWQVLTRDIASLNTSVICNSTLQLDLQGYNTSAVVEALNFTSVTSSAVRASLGLVASETPAPLVGIAYTRFRVPNVTSGALRFQVSCELCALYVNGLRILDLYDARSFLSPVTQISNCINLPVTSLHDLELRFGIGNGSATTTLVVGWRPCQDLGGTVQPLGPYIMNNVLWRPSSGVAGYVPGVQCDVWLDTAGRPVEGRKQPQIKFRLPTVLAQTPVLKVQRSPRTFPEVYNLVRSSGCSANETAARSNCSAAMAFALEDVIYNFIRDPNKLYGAPVPDRVYMRCWTYVNAGFRNGSLQIYAPRESNVYLGSQMVLNSQRTMNTLYATYAPNVTAHGSYYQLLVMDYPNLLLSSIVGIRNGTAGDLMIMDMERTLLPIPFVAATGISNCGTTTNGSSGVGGRRSFAATAGSSSEISETYHISKLGGDRVDRAAQVTDSSAHSSNGHLSHRKLQQLGLSNNNVSVPTSLGSSSYTRPPLRSECGLLGMSYNITNTNWGLLSTVLNEVSLITGNNSMNCSIFTLNPGGSVCPFPDNGVRKSTSTLIQLWGYLRVPANSSGSTAMSRWVLRMIENSTQQTTAINIADVTIRNGIEVYDNTAPANETLIWLPSNSTYFLPVVITTRVDNRATQQGDFSGISLVPPDQSALRNVVNSSLWYKYG